jgi:hypothetical protein
MACDISSKGRVVIVTFGDPEIADLERIMGHVVKVHEKTGLPILYVSRVLESSKPPSSQFNQALKTRMGELLALCCAFHAVMEGHGFLAAIKRTAVSAAFLTSGKRSLFHVHGTMDEMIRSVGPAHRPEVVEALRASNVVQMRRGADPKSDALKARTG